MRNIQELALPDNVVWVEQLIALTALRQIEPLEQHLLKMLSQVFGFEEAALYVTDDQYQVARLFHYVWMDAFIEGDSPMEHIVKVNHSNQIPAQELSILEALKVEDKIVHSSEKAEHLVGYKLTRDERGYRYLIFPVGLLPSPEREDFMQRLLAIFQNYELLLNNSRCDKLTGLLNRHSLEQNIDQLWTILAEQREVPVDTESRSIESMTHYWIGVVDIDHFKRVNDTYGHLLGDEVLLRVARMIKSSLRNSDLVYRYGGEEFVVILATNNAEGAVCAFERVRRAVEKYQFPQVHQVTISIGFSGADASMLPQAVLNRADRALYKAKEDGRNRVYQYESLTASKQLQDVDSGSVELF